LRGTDLAGEVRLGLQEDFGEALLSTALRSFARAHPRVRVQARLARNAELVEQVQRGKLDLALVWDGGQLTPHSRRVARLPMQWIGRADAGQRWPEGEPVPLAVLEAPCLMRSTAITALEKAKLPWRVAFTSPSLAGIWAAVGAGLGVTVRTSAGLPPELAPLQGLPRLPSIGLQLHRCDEQPAPPVQRLEALLQAHLRESLGLSRRARQARIASK
jgi:DNA-binding transcriptional LysR family regulator